MELFKRTKNTGKPVLRQIIDLIPTNILESAIAKHKSDKHCSVYRTRDQLVSLMFGQLNKCYTLEDISAGIGVSTTYISDLGLSQSPARSTMSDGNKKRDWQVFETLYYKLLNYYSAILKAQHKSELLTRLTNHKAIKIIDSTTISLCLNTFNWAKFRTAKGGLKIHVAFDDALALPDLINITEAATHDLKGHPRRIYPAGTIILEDRAYVDYSLIRERCAADNHFVTRCKESMRYERIKERALPEDGDEHILVDQDILLSGKKASDSGMGDFALRRVVVYDEQKDRTIELLTNNFEWSAATVAELYKKRWDIELFFKSMKQNLQIKTFTGTSEYAVRSQIYVALICYLLLELLRRCTCRASHAFSNFVERIRICLSYYLSLDYVCNTISQGAKKVIRPEHITDLFSGENTEIRRPTTTNTPQLALYG
jgi:hypothetical protein